jgi:hypothetical protein
MQKAIVSKGFLEVLWWIFTAVCSALILLPLWREVPNYPFLVINILAILVFITFTRYIFLLNYTFLTKYLILKVVLSLACIPLIFYLVNNINHFQTYLDEQGVLGFMGHLPPERIDALDKYMRAEFLLFGVGSVIASTMLPFRLLASVWRQYNKKRRV